MELEFQVLSLNDLDQVAAFARENLARTVSNEAERTFLSWDARWRQESLEHYLSLSWSFVARHRGRIVGFFLAQPIRYMGGHTQTLWVEHVEASEPGVVEALIDLAIRSARGEHLQRVLFSNADSLTIALAEWPHNALADKIIEVKTTKG
jgi:hypothetical protein